jgi:hypothetical protein
MPPDRTLPPPPPDFAGVDAPYLGYFPPVVDGTLLALVTTSRPDDPERTAMSVGALAEQRFMALDALERGATAHTHVQAAVTVNRALTQGRPFGLYLRNFALGVTATQGGEDRFGTPQVVTIGYRQDRALQRLVADVAGDAPGFVAIANQAGYGEPIPSLVLANEQWEGVAETLIQHAGVIVVYFLTTTAGVCREFELLRAANAQQRTLLVVADEDPRSSGFEPLIDALARREPRPAPPPRAAPPDDFPHRVDLVLGENDAEVRAALELRIRAAQPAATREPLPLPMPHRPPQAALVAARDRALAEFDVAQRHIEAGEGVAAEDALMRVIAFTHWADDPIGRAIAFFTLANVERRLLKYPNEAVDCYLHALRLFAGLQRSSELAREHFAPAREQLIAYLEEKGDRPRANWVRDTYAVRT